MAKKKQFKFRVFDCYGSCELRQFVRKHNAEKFARKEMADRHLPDGIIVQPILD